MLEWHSSACAMTSAVHAELAANGSVHQEELHDLPQQRGTKEKLLFCDWARQ